MSAQVVKMPEPLEPVGPKSWVVRWEPGHREIRDTRRGVYEEHNAPATEDTLLIQRVLLAKPVKPRTRWQFWWALCWVLAGLAWRALA